VWDPLIHWVDGGVGAVPSRHSADETDWAPVLVTEGNAYVIADGDFAVQEAMHMAFKTAFTASVRRVTI
jgi:hypothetical protein